MKLPTVDAPAIGVGHRIGRAQDFLLALMVIAMMVAIVVQVICSAFNFTPLATFTDKHFLVGRAITLNSLLDFQWHLLVIVGILPSGIVWLREGHVRVDFIYSSFSTRTKRIVDLVGNLLFAGPFLYMTIPATWDFASRAFRSGESSANGGMSDLWVIKGVLFLGLTLLAAAIVVETIKMIRS